ncbi:MULTISPECIES: hypothetical protein [unclassified Flavobacterium]|uniref:hypothetical protein n=1 Tax=unclassified Flavobacterium TaxID=196869 RepID=UPI002616F6CF|nr:hypothetical protein [Flavobacterium sp.]
MNNIETTRKLMREIFTITVIIQKEFPELYEHLGETPLFLSYGEDQMAIIDFEQYLESIKQQLSIAEKDRLLHQMCE